MGWQDRSYYRDSGQGSGNPLMWAAYGRVPLFTIFGIRVQIHASLIIWIGITLLLGMDRGFGWQDRLIASVAIFLIILLHEFGHCFAARWMGGTADEIVMHPLGGVALTAPPRRWWPNFVTAAGGPLVNVIICVITGAVMWWAFRTVWVNPFHPSPIHLERDMWPAYLTWGRWVYWTYFTSGMLLAFNLLPIFPLDGGQMLQSLLWPKFGYYKATLFSATVGMIGAAVAAVVGLATWNFFLAILAILGFNYCLQYRRMLLAEGPWAFQDENSVDYSASLFGGAEPKRKHVSKRVIRRAQKREAEEQAEQERVDAILAKVSAHGMHSLTWFEKRALKKATEHQRKRDEGLRDEMTRKGF